MSEAFSGFYAGQRARGLQRRLNPLVQQQQKQPRQTPARKKGAGDASGFRMRQAVAEERREAEGKPGWRL